MPGVLVVVLGSAMTAEARDVPLAYHRNADRLESTFCVARVRLAGHDLQAAGAPPAEMEMDFETSTSRGLSLGYERYTTRSSMAGRPCIRGLMGVVGLVVEDKRFVSTTRTLYLQAEYYDQAATGSLLRVGYDAMRYGHYRDATSSAGVAVGSSGTWKTAQFVLDDANFGNRKHGPVDFGLRMESPRELVGWSHQSVEQGKGKPPADCRLPELADKKPTWFTLRLGGRERVGILDGLSSLPKSAGRLFFDANANGDLTDDPVLEGLRAGGFDVDDSMMWFGAFPPCDLVIEENGTTRPYSIRWAAYSMNMPMFGRRTEIMPSSNCSYRGEFELGGTRYRIGLVDNNCDGRFDATDLASRPVSAETESGTDATSSSEDAGSGDGLHITDAPELNAETAASFRLGTDLALGESLFTVGVDIAGGRLRLEESTTPLAPLRLTGRPHHMKLRATDGSRSVAVYKPGGRLMLAEGTYRFTGYTMRRDDAQGDGWTLSGEATDQTSSVVVAQGREATMVLGEPFRPVASVAQWGGQPAITSEGSVFQFWKRRKEVATLEFTIRGAGGEIVTSLSHDRGDRTRIEMSECSPNLPNEPTFRILKPDGEIAGQGAFQYG